MSVESDVTALAESLRARADALLESGDPEMEMIGEHYAGIADEVKEILGRAEQTA